MDADATVLDDLSGFEFEDVMVEVFRKMGYRNVRQAERIADKGRDILMEEPRENGPPSAVVVECKHTATVGRPVVQKLHSAVQTYDHPGPKRGMVATTGRFTRPAEEYAARVGRESGAAEIELFDGQRLREVGDEIGMDLYSGRIEIVCEETLAPPRDRESVASQLRAAASSVENLDPELVAPSKITLTLLPIVYADTHVNAVFETSVGVIHRVDERDPISILADRDGPRPLAGDVSRLVARNVDRTEPIALDRYREQFDAVDTERFGRTEAEYRDWIAELQCDRFETTVRYTGDNNVTYTRTCRPTESDVSIRSLHPVYVPAVDARLELGEYAYQHSYLTADRDTVVMDGAFGHCVHCGGDGLLTYCENCGSVNCDDHIETERLDGAPVCTGCAVTESFLFKTKYFYDRENLERFRAEYDAMPFYRKAMENPLLAGAAAIIVGLLLFGLLGLVI
ncbi:restriction endonuclease [Natranaeroarchaeum sulfidigenes]|uniref:Restriction endonuclease n=1 Tax=Natranaeroarchaeum sulfidigenes TaxID=2784880 RepID=A0A897MST3_9EURY|nr:restriction endonuclease [Natranaeroarchaeum sulfidigenes]QSG01285.1 Restriction endonuclease [Natranaeroarchaeum sulfidigenes]